ncbi:helix-turn-helix domain-containing protein [Rathayibacter sp. VKM Ac-2801]|uniref:helix-turn-helix domain-containing protein n=1 Tax=Rathayibacter sp. VKM Ac-2801 TaxID=2609255 RepID=UPI00131FFF03|nr:helix-turn-helix domain-containing protein [Rathayibacter sp. VKM Ac-2801]QHC71561.1 helix-turn-helix domain-containing protein [Rathayibacter sp. VKM Ac-2801]
MTASEQPAALRGLVETLQLSGPRVEAWLRSIRWSADGAPPLHLAGDVLAVDGFRLSRLWHTPGTLRTDPPLLPRDRAEVDLIVPVAGEVVVDGPLDSARLRPGGLALLRRDDSARFQAEEDSAWLALRTSWGRLGLTSALADEPSCTLPAADSYSGAFVSLINATLNADLSAGEPGFGELRRALEAAASALVKQSLHPSLPEDGLEGVLLRAIAVIEAEAGDADFTASELTRRLGVSRATLDRAFHRRGTTVAATLRERRVHLAASLLAASPSLSPSARAAVAEQAGFRTLRAMDRALSRSRDDHRD